MIFLSDCKAFVWSTSLPERFKLKLCAYKIDHTGSSCSDLRNSCSDFMVGAEMLDGHLRQKVRSWYVSGTSQRRGRRWSSHQPTKLPHQTSHSCSNLCNSFSNFQDSCRIFRRLSPAKRKELVCERDVSGTGEALICAKSWIFVKNQ